MRHLSGSRISQLVIVSLVAGVLGAVVPVAAASAADIQDVTAPGAPTITVAAQDGSFDVSWSLADTGGEAPTAWEVDHREVAAATWDTTPLDAAADHLDVPGVNGTTYEVRVRAQNSAGWGPYSDVATVKPSNGLPSAPQDVTATGGVESVTVVWKTPADTGSGLTGYRIEWRVSGGAWNPIAAPAGATTLTFYTPGNVGIESQVTATSAAGDSPTEAAGTVTAQPLLISSSLSATTIRPYKDGFQDTVTARAKTRASTPATLKVLNSSGTVVRSIAVGANTAFGVVWNGRSNSGSRVPVGTYRMQLVAAWPGPTKTLLSSTVTVRLSQVDRPTVKRPYATVYPTRDGYRDSVTFTVTASLPAHGTLRVTKGGKVAFTKTLKQGRSWRPKWNGRFRGAVMPGTYRVTVTLKGGEGKARTRALSQQVSPKHLVTRSSSTWYSARTAFDRCWGSGYFTCESTQYFINGAMRNAVEYYNGADTGDILWSSQSLPLPNGGNRVLKWRLGVEASTDDSTYYLIYCPRNALEVDPCKGGGYLPTWSDGVFVGSAWTKLGVADGRANFAVATEDWGFLYVSRFRLDVKYQVLV